MELVELTEFERSSWGPLGGAGGIPGPPDLSCSGGKEDKKLQQDMADMAKAASPGYRDLTLCDFVSLPRVRNHQLRSSHMLRTYRLASATFGSLPATYLDLLDAQDLFCGKEPSGSARSTVDRNGTSKKVRVQNSQHI